mmetsp:Transcript_28443/g.88030  ORF Transcript_28443/g.88030 Transcript_28443/m.88030 type:complete len:86 (+) Transcript_28443:316-573(+)
MFGNTLAHKEPAFSNVWFPPRCPQCGHAHKNPALVRTYQLCHHCSFILEPAHTISAIVERRWLRETGKVRVLAASYRPGVRDTRL